MWIVVYRNSALFTRITIIVSSVWLVFSGGSLPAQSSFSASSSACSQPTQVQDAIIREAESDQYTTRRVEFVGNRHTRDTVLRSRINIGLQEGELFTRRNLMRSLNNVNRLKQIYPVKIRHVELRLNRSNQTVDVTICFRERGTRRQVTTSPK